MERQEMLKELETQVSDIKDPELKKIAFDKLLSRELDKENKKGSKKKKKPKDAKKAKEKGKHKTSQYYSIEQVRDEVKKLNITGKLKGLTPFNSCKEQWEHCLWVLAAAKKQKIDGLNNHEIAYILSKRLYKKTKYSSVNNIHKKVSSGFVHSDPETNLWLITPDGEDHLANLNKPNNPKVNI